MPEKLREAFSISVSEEGEISLSPDTYNPDFKLLKPSVEDSDDWRSQPISFDFLTQMTRENPIHETCLERKVSLVMIGLDLKAIPYDAMAGIVNDYFITGNAYLLISRNRLEHLPARFIRVGKKKYADRFVVVKDDKVQMEYPSNEVIHFKRVCAESMWYGLPNYLSALPEIVLAKAARNYRLRFYVNGTHGRLILTNLPNPQVKDENGKLQDSEMIESLRNTMMKTKKTGQHKSFHVNLDDPKIESVEKLISVQELGQKLDEDDYSPTMQDTSGKIVVAHGMHPDLIGFIGQQKNSTNLRNALDVARETVAMPVQEYLIAKLKEHGHEVEIKTEPSA